MKTIKPILQTALFIGIWVLTYFKLVEYVHTHKEPFFYSDMILLFICGLIACLLFIGGAYLFRRGAGMVQKPKA